MNIFYSSVQNSFLPNLGRLKLFFFVFVNVLVDNLNFLVRFVWSIFKLLMVSCDA